MTTTVQIDSKRIIPFLLAGGLLLFLFLALTPRSDKNRSEKNRSEPSYDTPKPPHAWIKLPVHKWPDNLDPETSVVSIPYQIPNRRHGLPAAMLALTVLHNNGFPEHTYAGVHRSLFPDGDSNFDVNARKITRFLRTYVPVEAHSEPIPPDELAFQLATGCPVLVAINWHWVCVVGFKRDEQTNNITHWEVISNMYGPERLWQRSYVDGLQFYRDLLAQHIRRPKQQPSTKLASNNGK